MPGTRDGTARRFVPPGAGEIGAAPSRTARTGRRPAGGAGRSTARLRRSHMASPDSTSGGRPSTGATAAGSTAAGATSAGSQRASGDTRSKDRVDTARESSEPAYRDDSEARDRFGGINWGAGFFGWLVAIGITIILSGIVGAVVSAIGSQVDMTLNDARTSAGKIGIGAGIARLVVTILVALVGAVAGTEYNVFDRITLPRLPLDLRDLGIGGLITAAAVLIGTLLAAVVGGKVGHRYHDKVD